MDRPRQEVDISRSMVLPNGVTTRDLSERITLKRSRSVWVVRISSKADFGSACFRSDEG